MDELIEVIAWVGFGAMATILWFLTGGIESWAFAGGILLVAIIIMFYFGELIFSAVIGIIYGIISATFLGYSTAEYLDNSFFGGMIAIGIFVFAVIWAGITGISD